MKWSGLAPAVDAHLARWSVIQRLVDIIDASGDDATRAIATVSRADAGMRWLTFARSYGLPGADGRPAASMELVPRGDDPELLLAAVEDGSTISGRERFEDTRQSVLTGMLLIQREHQMLTDAVTHYVSAEVVDEVTEFAEASFPEPLFDTDLLARAGFAVLEKPVAVPDLNVDTGLPDYRVHVHVRAIGWHRHDGIKAPTDGTIGPGVTLFLYTTPDDYFHGYVQELRATGHDFENPAADTDVDGPFVPLEVIPWRFGAEWEPRSDDVNHHVPGTVPTPVAFQRRWFFAFMRLMWQEIIVRHATHEPRQATRRWDRMAKRKELLDYSTLRLRRVVDPNYVPSGLGIPLEHRVLVRAHPRRQWIPSLGPARLPDGTMDPSTHRLIWIEAFWKGPEDGPLGPLHKATSFVR